MFVTFLVFIMHVRNCVMGAAPMEQLMSLFAIGPF